MPRVRTEFDFRDSTFSPSGFLNYIIRYGGGAGQMRSRTHAIRHAAELDDATLFPLRKYVLDTADINNGNAKAVLDKIICFSGEVFTRSEKVHGITKSDREMLKNVKKSLECSPLYKVTPVAKLIASGGKQLATNISVKPLDSGVTMQIQNMKIDIESVKGYEAGKIPIFTGRFDVEFFTPHKGDLKKTNILKLIAESQDLGYIFDLKNEYRVVLTNESLEQPFRNEADQKAYQALIASEITFITNTIRYELVSWKPQENRVSFSVDFAQSSAARRAITRSGDSKGVPVENPTMDAEAAKKAETKRQNEKAGTQAVKVYSLMNALVHLLQSNSALFSYTFIEQDDDRMLYNVIAQNEPVTAATVESSAPTETAKELEQLEGYSVVKEGTFFLFRSLLIAAIQTFYREQTPLDKKVYDDILIETETFDNMLLLLDESAMPNEVGTFYSRGEDIRNTFETIVVDFQIFALFMHDLYAKVSTLTLDYFIEEMFRDLLPRVMKASISTQNADKWTYHTIYKNITEFNMSDKAITTSFGDGYSLRFLGINPEELQIEDAHPKNAVWRSYLDDTITQKVPPSFLNGKAGNLRVKNVTAQQVSAALTNVNDIEEADLKFVMLVDKNTSAPKNVAPTERLVAMGFGPEQLLKRGIIAVDWYDRENPKKNLNYRILADGSDTPFSFSVINNKNIDSMRRVEAGETPYIRNFYDCSFSIADVLGVQPFKTKFLFYPSFFYGGAGVGDLKIDKFGFSGIYTCKSVSVSLNQESGRFQSDLKLQYLQEILPDDTVRKRAAEEARKKLEGEKKKGAKKKGKRVSRKTPTELIGKTTKRLNELKAERADATENLNSFWTMEFKSTSERRIKLANEEIAVLSRERDELIAHLAKEKKEGGG